MKTTRERMLAQAVIAASWVLLLVTIGIGVHAGIDAARESRAEPVPAEAAQSP